MKVGGRCHEVEMLQGVDQDWVKRKVIECPRSGQRRLVYRERE